MTHEVGRKVMVLITDGMDEGSRLKIDEAIRASQKADTVIYSIYYVDPSAYRGFGYFGSVTDSYLRKMSEDTGGRVFRVDKKHTLPEVFKELQDEMRSQYAISYTPTNEKKDGSFRRIDLRTKDHDLKVQVRKGYYAAGAEQ
jgi:VWFA-related protein